MGGTGRACDEITEAIDRVLADMDTGGRVGGVCSSESIGPERIVSPASWGLTPAEAEALRDAVEFDD